MYYLPVLNHLYSIDESGEIKPTNDSSIQFRRYDSYEAAEEAIAEKIEAGFFLHTYLIIEKSDYPTKNN